MGQFVTMMLRCEARVESFPYKRWLKCLGQSRERFTASELRKAIDFLDRVAEEESELNVKIISQVKDELIEGLCMAFSVESFRKYLCRDIDGVFVPIEITRRIFELSCQSYISRRNFVWKRHHKMIENGRVHCTMIESRITRNDPWRYSLFTDKDLNGDCGFPSFLLSCRRTRLRSRFELFYDEYEISVAEGWSAFVLEQNVVAVLRSNAIGTRWILIEKSTKRTLMRVQFERNVLRNSPVKQFVSVLNASGQYDTLRTCEAVWIADRYCLNFGGRVKCTSSKNFQVELAPPPLREEEKAETKDTSLSPSETYLLRNSNVLCQFGRLSEKCDTENKYALDFQAPFCPITAFALAICQVSRKLAC